MRYYGGYHVSTSYNHLWVPDSWFRVHPKPGPPGDDLPGRHERNLLEDMRRRRLIHHKPKLQMIDNPVHGMMWAKSSKLRIEPSTSSHFNPLRFLR